MNNVAFYILATVVILTALSSVVLPNFKYALWSFFAMSIGISLFYFLEKATLLAILQIIVYSVIFFILISIAKKKNFYTKTIMKFNLVNFLFLVIASAITLYLIFLYSAKYEKEYIIKNSLYFVKHIASDYFLIFFLLIILIFLIMIGMVTLNRLRKENKNG